MDCTYTALYPVFKTPQSALHITCLSPNHTHSYRAVYLTLGPNIHTHSHTVGHREQLRVKYLAQGYIDVLTAWAGIEPTTFWLKDESTPSQPQSPQNIWERYRLSTVTTFSARVFKMKPSLTKLINECIKPFVGFTWEGCLRRTKQINTHRHFPCPHPTLVSLYKS